MSHRLILQSLCGAPSKIKKDNQTVRLPFLLFDLLIENSFDGETVSLKNSIQFGSSKLSLYVSFFFPFAFISLLSEAKNFSV